MRLFAIDTMMMRTMTTTGMTDGVACDLGMNDVGAFAFVSTRSWQASCLG